MGWREEGMIGDGWRHEDGRIKGGRVRIEGRHLGRGLDWWMSAMMDGCQLVSESQEGTWDKGEVGGSGGLKHLRCVQGAAFVPKPGYRTSFDFCSSTTSPTLKLFFPLHFPCVIILADIYPNCFEHPEQLTPVNSRFFHVSDVQTYDNTLCTRLWVLSLSWIQALLVGGSCHCYGFLSGQLVDAWMSFSIRVAPCTGVCEDWSTMYQRF